MFCSRKHCTERSAPGATRCAHHEHRRIWGRDNARRKRESKLAGQMQSAHRCPKRQGPGVCGGPLRTEIGPLGHSVVVCEWCERQRRGICRDCPVRVEGQVGRARRCAEHKRLFRNECTRRWAEAHHEEALAMSRATYQEHPDVRARRNEYKRAYRKANPEKVRAQKKRYVERHKNDPNSKYRRYHVRYRRRYREQKRELERDRLQVAPPPRKTSPKCTRCGKSTRWRPVHKGHAGRPWTTCTKCLFPCERKVRARNRRRQLQRAKEWLESIPKPARIRRPPAAAVRGPGWERLCVTPGCDIVVTHRKKKCTKCRAHDAELARQQLATHRGRGRRVDLELAS